MAHKNKDCLPCFREKPKNRIITSEGYPYILLTLVLAVVAWLAWSAVAGILLFILAMYVVSFFRNPFRSIPAEEGLIVSPADGTVLEIVECEESLYLHKRAKRISIFMSPLNCHINRAPIAGEVEQCFYRKGKFKAAYSPKAMEYNEHHAVILRDSHGQSWMVVQIAGWLARRIVSYVCGGEKLKKGEPFGLIQFGSRADLYCPLNCEFFVKPGQKVYAGKTVLGRLV